MESIQKLFETTDLYSILIVTAEEAANPKLLKSAYFKAALATHPDKGPEKERELRTQKFQVVTKIYELLKDDDLRKSYDETGEWPDKEEYSMDLASFGRIDENDILEFKKMYIGSDEERQDVKKFYEERDGNIIHVIDNLFFANLLDDEERVQGIIDDLIEKEEMKKLTKGVVSKTEKEKKVRKAQKEAKEAEELRKEMKLDGGLDSLKLAMAKNSAKRSNFLDDLEKKYGGGEQKNGQPKAKVGRPKRTQNESDQGESSKSKKAKLTPEPKTSSGRVTRSRSNT